jgi:hypothetical protein
MLSWDAERTIRQCGAQPDVVGGTTGNQYPDCTRETSTSSRVILALQRSATQWRGKDLQAVSPADTAGGA